jgi:glycerol-3-phosphate acyltransferase PlsY
MGLDPWWVVAGGLASVVGHIFSIFLGFKGGKGVATSLGVIIGLDPVVAGTAFAGWALLVLLTRYISVASIVAAISVPTQMFLWHARNVETAYKDLAVVAALMVVLKHIPNVKRLFDGTENKIGRTVTVRPKGGEEDG